MTTSPHVLKFVRKVEAYLDNCHETSLQKLATFWRLMRLRGEDLTSARVSVKAMVEASTENLRAGNPILDNYIYLGERILGLGELLGIDFLYLVRQELNDGLEKNFIELMSFPFGWGKGECDMTNDVEKLIRVAEISGYDIGQQLNDFFLDYERMAPMYDFLKPDSMRALVENYQPMPSAEPYPSKFTVRDSSRRYFSGGDRFMCSHLEEHLAALPPGIS